MKNLLLLLVTILISTNLSSANLNKNLTHSKDITINALQQPVFVTLGTWCGQKIKYTYTPKEGMTQEQIDNEIGYINYVIEYYSCPQLEYI